MPKDELAQLVEDVRTVVRASVPAGELDYGVMSDPASLDRCVITLIHRESDGAPIAFNALHLLPCELRGRPEQVVHLGLLMIAPGVRQQGLTGALYGITCFLLSMRRQMRPFWVSNVTQVPVVFGIVGDFIEDAYPSVHPGARRSFDHLQLARQVTSTWRHVYGTGPEAEFDEERFILTNSYTGGSDNLKKSYDEAPKYRDERVNALCAAQLDYDRGDDFVQLGRFTFAVARRYLTRSGSMISPAMLVLRGAMLFVEGVVAPVAQWLTPSRAMGALRTATEPGVTPP